MPANQKPFQLMNVLVTPLEPFRLHLTMLERFIGLLPLLCGHQCGMLRRMLLVALLG